MDESPQSPLCPGSRVTLEDEIAGVALAAAWERQLGVHIPESFSSCPVFRLWSCVRSQLRFITPVMAGDGEFYARLRLFDWYYLPQKWEHEYAAGLVAKSDRVLDVGCGDGAFLDRCVARGVRCEGLELNRLAVAHAAAKGHTIWPHGADRHLTESGEGAYDLVSAFQVLEHVEAPLSFLRSLVALAKVGGKIVIAVPNCDGWAGATGGVLQWPPHHLSWWGAASLVFLQQILPVRLLDLQFEPLVEAHQRARISGLLFPTSAPKAPSPRFGKRLGRSVLCRFAARVCPKMVRGHGLVAVFERTGEVVPS